VKDEASIVDAEEGRDEDDDDAKDDKRASIRLRIFLDEAAAVTVLRG
jgi:hypothetical protein